LLSWVTSPLYKGSFVQNRVVQNPKFDAKPNRNLTSNPNPDPISMLIRFGQMTFAQVNWPPSVLQKGSI